MTFLVERNGRELSQIILDKTNKTNKLSATFTDAWFYSIQCPTLKFSGW